MCDEDTNDNADEDSSSLLELDLTRNEQNRLVLFCVKRFFSDLSVRVFEDMQAEGHDFKDALYQSALNEMVNVVLEDCVANDRLANDDKNEEKEADTQD